MKAQYYGNHKDSSLLFTVRRAYSTTKMLPLLSVVFKVVKNETIELCSPHARSSASQAKEEYILCSQHRL